MSHHVRLRDDISMTTLMLDCGDLGERPAIVTYRRHESAFACVTVLRVALADDNANRMAINFSQDVLQRLAFRIEDDIDAMEIRHDFPPEQGKEMDAL